MTQTLIQIIAATAQAWRNTLAPSHKAWHDRHETILRAIERDLLPSGAGFDAGTTIDLDACKADRVVLHTSFHHMNEAGFYDGWTEHKITLRPTFDGFDLSISGPDRNEIKDYISNVFHNLLASEPEVWARCVQDAADRCKPEIDASA